MAQHMVMASGCSDITLYSSDLATRLKDWAEQPGLVFLVSRVAIAASNPTKWASKQRLIASTKLQAHV